MRLEDMQGAVHCHTVWSDGEAHRRGDGARGRRPRPPLSHHHRPLRVGDATRTGSTLDRLRRQRDEIARVQERVRVRLLRGTESDILRDGALDFPDAVLRQFDVVIASIHNRSPHGRRRDDPPAWCARCAIPLFKIWGHALGRYVLSRPPFACRLDEVLDAIAESRAAIEVNGDPHRLDLAPEHIRAARRRGIRFVISADAHSTARSGTCAGASTWRAAGGSAATTC